MDMDTGHEKCLCGAVSVDCDAETVLVTSFCWYTKEQDSLKLFPLIWLKFPFQLFFFM